MLLPTGMNEIYVASPTYKINSDKVFYMEHVDGPYVWWPFCQVYRVLIAVNENKQIMTQFPIARQIWRITKGDVLGLTSMRASLDQESSYRCEHRLSYSLESALCGVP